MCYPSSKSAHKSPAKAEAGTRLYRIQRVSQPSNYLTPRRFASATLRSLVILIGLSVACLHTATMPSARADDNDYITCLQDSGTYDSVGGPQRAITLGRIAYDNIHNANMDRGDQKIALAYGYHLPLSTAAAIVNCAVAHNPDS